MQTKMSIEHWWNYINRRKPKNVKKDLSQSHFFHNKFHVDSPGIKTGPPQWGMATNRLNNDAAVKRKFDLNDIYIYGSGRTAQ
jgi:hypothetical protein